MPLNLEPNFADPDAFYERLIDLHAGLSDEQSRQLNGQLAELLRAQIDDPGVLREATAIANEGQAADARIDENPACVARLILLFANHLGDAGHIYAILARAKDIAANLSAAA